MAAFRCYLLLCIACLPFGRTQAQNPVATFTIRDHLKRHWQRDLVFFPVPASVFQRDDLVLLGPDNSPTLYQWAPSDRSPGEEPCIAFRADVTEGSQASYRLVAGDPVRKSDLSIRKTADSVTVTNDALGITLGGAKAATVGPIAAIALPGGKSVVSGELHCDDKPQDVAVQVLASGPVFVDAVVEYDFPDYRFWRFRIRVISGEPAILIDEQFNLPEGAKYVLNLADGWKPDQLFYRDNGNRCRLTRVASVSADPIFHLQAWPFWWGEELQSNWVTLCGVREADCLTLAAREPGDWVTPGRTEWETAVTLDKELRACFQLQGFERKWMLVAQAKSAVVREEQLDQLATPSPQEYLIRHGDFPLDLIKDYALEWDDCKTARPRLFTTQDELTRFRKRFHADAAKLEELRKKPVFGYSMDDHVAYYLATGDETLARRLYEFSLNELQTTIDGYVGQQRLRNPGSCPHHRNRGVFWGAIAADLAMSSDSLTADERDRLKAQLAFLAYTLERPLIISPERGYHANPNMTTMARAMLGIIACTIPNHPMAADWAQMAIAEMEHELTEWSGPNGGWLEAPHYATASLDMIISLALALRGTGFSETEWQFHPRLRAAVGWLAKISTPPDSRLDDCRHMPAIGNTYLGEPTCLPGWMATIWQEKDPAFSRQMQWMWKAQGMRRTPGIGGAYPGLQGYNHVMLDEQLRDEAPPYGSELFPAAGAVFRSHFPSDRETYLHYIQGAMHQHYDFDEGSFVFWGKGSPLCEDFGYYGRAPAADHSRIDDGFYEALGVEGKIQEFASGDGVDYLRGERSGWHRQILFVKDGDSLGPNYALIRDAVLNGRDFDWRIWIATDDPINTDTNPIRAKGRFGVDLVVYFLAPDPRQISSEEATRTAGTAGWGHDNRSSTQRSLAMNKVAAGQPVCVVLYPVQADQPSPRFSTLADGRGVKIETSFGTDYAMLGLEQFAFAGDGIRFSGKAGVIQLRSDGSRLSLPRRGTIVCRDQQLDARSDSDRTATRTIR